MKRAPLATIVVLLLAAVGPAPRAVAQRPATTREPVSITLSFAKT